MSRTEKEIEFYKDLFGKAFTLFLLVITGTTTTLFRYGINGWSIAGMILSLHLLVALAILGYIYKRKINELEE
jgi:hypothetical protein